MARFYAGIGSRETPKHLRPLLNRLASELEEAGFTLRSGAAPGADTWFEEGVRNPANKRIYLPGSYFNQRWPNEPGLVDYTTLSPEALAKAQDYTHRLHPAGPSLRPFVQQLMGRNAMQVLGDDLATPAEFVLAYSPGGYKSGGTSQALRIARENGIRVINLANENELANIDQVIAEIRGGARAAPNTREIPMHYAMPAGALRSDLNPLYPEGATTLRLFQTGERIATTR
jgi:hypothetical protein